MNKNFTVQVTCNNEETKAKYAALAEKMANDSEFKSKLNMCNNESAVYDLYKENGYTDLTFKDFVEQFRDTISQIVSAQNAGSFELSEDELENVVGGFDWFKFATSVVSVVPIAGPIIAGAAKAIKAGIEGKGVEEIVKQAAVGVGLAMADAVVLIGTAGVGTVAATCIKVGMMAVKAGMNEAL